MDLKSNVDAEIVPRRVNNDVDIHECVTIMAEVHTVYDYFSHPHNFTELIDQLRSIREVSESSSVWIGADDKHHESGEWEVEFLDKVPETTLTFQVLHGKEVVLEGRVDFEVRPYNRGTLIHVKIEHDLQASKYIEAMKRALGQGTPKNLKHFLNAARQIIETGEISTTVGQPKGDNNGKLTTSKDVH